MIESIRSGRLELIYDEEKNTITFSFAGIPVIDNLEFSGTVDDMFQRALELWSKKYSGR